MNENDNNNGDNIDFKTRKNRFLRLNVDYCERPEPSHPFHLILMYSQFLRNRILSTYFFVGHA